MGMMVLFGTVNSSSGGAYEPNQLLSFGTTVLSSVNKTRTSLLRDSRFFAYVPFMNSVASLLIEGRNLFLSRYRSNC